jgi:hypothetical protein
MRIGETGGLDSREGKRYQSSGCTCGHQGDGYGEGNRGGGDEENGGVAGAEENGGVQHCLMWRGNHLTNGAEENLLHGCVVPGMDS